MTSKKERNFLSCRWMIIFNTSLPRCKGWQKIWAWRPAEIPNSNIQISEKCQVSTSNARKLTQREQGCWEIGFFWNLDVGIWNFLCSWMRLVVSTLQTFGREMSIHLR